MKVSLVESVGADFSVCDVEIATPQGAEVLVDIKAAGLCHSDHSIATMGLGYEFPIVLGHELAGVVTAVGPDVRDIALGDHVVGSLLQFCGSCIECLSGRTHRCIHPERTLERVGHSRLSRNGGAVAQMNGLGGFAQQALVHSHQLAVVPDDVPFTSAALLGCGVLTGAGAVLHTAGVEIGESTVIIGAGGVGLNAVSGARLAGADAIIVVDVVEEKLERAREFGATHLVNASAVDPVDEVRKTTGGRGVDHVFDFVGTRAVAAQALQMAAKGGGLYLIGLGEEGAALELDTVTMITQHLHVHGVWMGSSNLKRDIPLYASYYLSGRMNLDGLVSEEIGISQIGDAYRQLNGSSMARVVVTDFAN